MRQVTSDEEARLLAVKDRLIGAVRDELGKGDVTAPELLALLAFVTGLVLAHQDPYEITAQEGMTLVNGNILNGHRAAVKAAAEAATTLH